MKIYTLFMYAISMNSMQGSRVHAYRFNYDPRKGLVLINELFKQLKPGLSSYKDTPQVFIVWKENVKSDARLCNIQKGAESLVPLLDAALDEIPKDKRAETPVNIKATAGLRLLREQDAENLLQASRELLQKYPFLYDNSDGVEILEGMGEGNQLKNSLR